MDFLIIQYVMPGHKFLRFESIENIFSQVVTLISNRLNRTDYEGPNDIHGFASNILCCKYI